MFLRDAYKNLAIIPGKFNWQTACLIIGIFSSSEQSVHSILQSLFHFQIIRSKAEYFLMGPLEKTFALNSAFVRKEEQFEDVVCGTKNRFIEYFLIKFSDINDAFLLRRGAAKDIIFSIYKNEKTN